jgi:hypothetical protein
VFSVDVVSVFGSFFVVAKAVAELGGLRGSGMKEFGPRGVALLFHRVRGHLRVQIMFIME